MALQIENISRGRFAINLVNAWNRPELEKAGIGFAEHDERYAYGREWISVVKPLTAGERVSFTRRHFNIDDYELLPHDQYRARPTIYLGGESEPARALAADHADVWFINGQPLDVYKRQVSMWKIRSVPLTEYVPKWERIPSTVILYSAELP